MKQWIERCRPLVAAALMICVAACSVRVDPLPGFPRLMLWAWERPEDLRFPDPEHVGVAFLARTVFLRDGAAWMGPRMQPLLVAPGTKLMAVVRVESSGSVPARVDEAARLRAEATSMRDVSALQIDFDAKRSKRDFYRSLLTVVRSRLGEDYPLTITALVSWCSQDRWITGLPVAEATPMYFRMGIAGGSASDGMGHAV